MATTSPKWRIALLSAAAFSTLVLLLAASANRFTLSEWAYTSNIDLASQFKYQEPVIAGAPVQATGSDNTVHSHDSTPGGVSIPSGTEAGRPAKPHQRIVAMVFAGRKEYVSILDCYLQRNLVRNGGWLDEVMWVMRTNKTSDIVYIDELTDQVPEYSQHHVFDEEQDEIKPARKAYKLCHPNTLYIKIDDDILFMEDHAISTIIQRKIDNPNNLIVSANVINQPTFSWVTQVHLNNAKPYLPEFGKPDDFVDDDRRHMVDWRASRLPRWKESEDKAKFDINSAPPFRGHRWLPLPEGGNLDQTPIGGLVENSTSQALKGTSNLLPWTVAAQREYSSHPIPLHFPATYQSITQLTTHPVLSNRTLFLPLPSRGRPIITLQIRSLDL